MFNKLSTVCLSLLGVTCTPPSYGNFVDELLPVQSAVPGGVVVIPLEIPSQLSPLVKYQEKKTLIISTDFPDPDNWARWYAVVGIPLDAKAGLSSIQIETPLGIQEKSFMIKNKSYKVEKLAIPNQRKVTPLDTDFERITKETEEIVSTYNTWHDTTLHNLQLALPVKGRKSSPFGLRRIMNGIEKNPHSGLDIAAPKGTPVSVAKSGTVINTGDFFYSGNVVFVDHGQGFITSYAHLDTIDVKVGDTLTQGDILGTIGNTGRVTGAHLHFSVSLNGVRVDPQLFITDN